MNMLSNWQRFLRWATSSSMCDGFCALHGDARSLEAPAKKPSTKKGRGVMFKKGQEVVRILNISGVETAVIAKIAWVKKGVVTLEEWDTKHDAKTGHEINGQGLGHVRIIPFDE